MKKILPICSIVIETAAFDIHKITNPSVSGSYYQDGPKKGFYNLKAYVLGRNAYLCQACKGKTKDPKLHVHHLTFKSKGGTDSPKNLLTLSETCHTALHKMKDAQKESLKLAAKEKKKNHGRDPSLN